MNIRSRISDSPAPSSAQQVAALCYRDTRGGMEVLLVKTSNGRWVLPKGWPIDGLTDAQAAKQEAWEEAGVEKGKVAGKAIGRFLWRKRRKNGSVLRCDTAVYPLAVTGMADAFPEDHKRDRIWVTPEKAANLVEDPALGTIITTFADR